MPTSINITIEDAKGAKSTTSFNVQDGLTQNSLSEIAIQAVTAIRALVTGGIVSAQACISFDLSSIPNVSDVAVNSDVEEGARFIFNSAGGFSTSNRLPTFDEAYIIANTRFVDTVDLDVTNFVGLITGGVTTTDDGLVPITDYRGADVLSLDTARESFLRSRKVR